MHQSPFSEAGCKTHSHSPKSNWAKQEPLEMIKDPEETGYHLTGQAREANRDQTSHLRVSEPRKASNEVAKAAKNEHGQL